MQGSLGRAIVMITPRVSVLMPVYNTQAYLAEAVESILKQTFRDVEFLIIDDGSTDGSLAILRRYEKKDSRIRLISRENRGLVKTRNELLKEAKGEFAAWADSDDISYPERLEKQMACFADPAVTWVTAAIRLVDAEGWPIHTVQLKSQPGFTCVAMMRRETAVRLGGFREALRICEDRDMELRMREVGKAVSLADVLLDYRQHAHSVCNSSRLVVAQYQRVVDGLAEERRNRGSDALERGEPLEIVALQGSQQSEPLWATYSRWAWWALIAGNVATARRYAAKSLLRRPWAVESWRLACCALRGR